MNAMIDDDGIVTIGMSKKNAKILMDFLGNMCTNDITKAVEIHGGSAGYAKMTDNVLYGVYDVISDVIEGGDTN